MRQIFYLRSKIARLELKGIDGSLYIRWNLCFNSIILAKSYQLLHITFTTVLLLLFFFTFLVKWYNNKVLQVLHGCRQFVLWNVWLTPLTNVTLVSYWNFFFLSLKNHFWKRLTLSQRKVRITSSHYDPYKLGYTWVTMIITKSSTIK